MQRSRSTTCAIVHLPVNYLRQQDSQAEPRGLNVASISLQIYLQ